MEAHATRKLILMAANRVVRRDGVAHLTIDAVAREAGLSKGGVLYHFPSKEALIGGMVGSLLEGFTRDLSRATAQEEDGPGRWMRAYIRASCTSDPEEAEITTSLLAAIGTNPQLLEPFQRQYRQWQERAEQDGLPPALATLLRLAADGLWLADLFGLAPPEGALREQVIQALLQLAKSSQ
jgi:AcrR family transcriptional regulator